MMVFPEISPEHFKRRYYVGKIMFSLPRRRILKNKRDFQIVYQNGRSFANRYLVLYVFPLKTLKNKKVGFAAGKKLGNAVVRNRVKRLLRESYRLEQSKINDDIWLLLVGRKSAVNAKQPVIGKAFLSLAGKAGIIKQEA